MAKMGKAMKGKSRSANVTQAKGGGVVKKLPAGSYHSVPPVKKKGK